MHEHPLCSNPLSRIPIFSPHLVFSSWLLNPSSVPSVLFSFWNHIFFLCCLSSLFVPMSRLSHWDSTQSTVLYAELPGVFWWVKKRFISWALCWWTNVTAQNLDTIPATSVFVLSLKFRYYIFVYIFNTYFIMESIFLVEYIRSSCSLSLLTLCRVCYSLKYPELYRGFNLLFRLPLFFLGLWSMTQCIVCLCSLLLVLKKNDLT